MKINNDVLKQILEIIFNLKPYFSWNGLLRIPYNWEDDIHFTYKKDFGKIDILNYNNSDFYILDFHPIHIYLNTEKVETYNLAKSYYNNFEKLKHYRNTKTKGARDYLIETFKFINNNKLETLKLIDIYNENNTNNQ